MTAAMRALTIALALPLLGGCTAAPLTREDLRRLLEPPAAAP